MINIAHIDSILQIEHILEDFFYEDSLNGMPALIHEQHDILMSLYIKGGVLFLYVQEFANDTEWDIALCDADEDVADFLQDLPSALLWIINDAKNKSSVSELHSLVKELENQGYPADESYNPVI
jgi:hypothetical protein